MNLKSKFLTLLIVAVSLVAIILPASAFTQTVIMAASLEESFGFTVEPSTVFWALKYGQNDMQSTWVNATGSTGFKVFVRDDTPIGGVSHPGLKYLKNGGPAQNAWMMNPLMVSLDGVTYHPVTATDTLVYQGAASGYSNQIKYRQQVSVQDQTTVSGTDSYWSTLTWTGVPSE